MQEHAVPQNITSYQFHLIGNMTIKQFLILLAGVVLGFLSYTTNLPGFIKWPLIFFIGALAIGMAFVPYEDRSLDQWFVNFIRAIYRPTKFFWQRTPFIPAYFSYSPRDGAENYVGPPIDLSKYRSQQVTQYLSSLHSSNVLPPEDPLDLFATSTTNQLVTLFDAVAPASGVVPGKGVTVVAKPSLRVKPRRLGGVEVYRGVTTSQTVAVMPTAPAAPDNLSVFRQSSGEAGSAESMGHLSSHARVATTKKEVITLNVEPTTVMANETTNTDVSTDSSAYMTAENVTSQDTSSVPIPAVFNRDLPFPSLPTSPNVLVGMVHDNQHAIIPGAIVEILDSEHNTVRAMKTNNLGQFYISTALKTGTYYILADKEGYRFPTYLLTADDTVLLPMDIVASAHVDDKQG